MLNWVGRLQPLAAGHPHDCVQPVRLRASVYPAFRTPPARFRTYVAIIKTSHHFPHSLVAYSSPVFRIAVFFSSPAISKPTKDVQRIRDCKVWQETKRKGWLYTERTKGQLTSHQQALLRRFVPVFP